MTDESDERLDALGLDRARLDDLWHAANSERNAAVHGMPHHSRLDRTSDPATEALLAAAAARSLRDGPDLWVSSVSPKPLLDFARLLADQWQPKSILDPVCGYGFLLAACATESTRVMHGVASDEEAAMIARAVIGESARVIHGDCFEESTQLDRSYDLVVADPPPRVRRGPSQTSAIGGDKSPMWVDEALVVWAASLLSETGAALVTVGPSFFGPKGNRKVLDALGRTGHRISAALHLPAREQGIPVTTRELPSRYRARFTRRFVRCPAQKRIA